jgi:hypothetical protein
MKFHLQNVTAKVGDTIQFKCPLENKVSSNNKSINIKTVKFQKLSSFEKHI